MRTLSIDIETFSSTDLGDCGVYKYVESPDFDILLFGYCYDDNPVEVIDLTKEKLPAVILSDLIDPSVIKTAWNANFERTCLAKYLGHAMPPEQWRDTMVAALEAGLPAALGKAALALGFEEDKQKDRAGKALIRYFSMPCKPTKANGGRTRNMPSDAPEKWQQYMDYNRQDVVVEREIAKMIDPINDREQCFWALDQKINDRGICIDMDLAKASVYIDDQAKKQAFDTIQEITGVNNPNSRAQIKAWVEKEIGKPLEKFDKDTLSDLMKTLPDGDVKTVVSMRLKTTKTSVAKYKKMLDCVGSDNRARGLFQFYGASRTGRFSGKMLQLQNLSKNKVSDLELARETVKQRDFSWAEMLYGDAQSLLSELVRTALIARDGCRFIVSDFASVENVTLAYISNEQWCVDAYHNKEDLYCVTASKMFNVPVEKHGRNKEYRKYGKITTLACGYGGSVGAMYNFGADKMGISEDTMRKMVADWRKANPHIVRFWRDVSNAAMRTVKTGRVVKLHHGIAFGMSGNDMLIKLPSKRFLRYKNMRVEDNRRFGEPGLVFDGVQQMTHKWGAIDTYSSKLVENITQAICRDILCEAMLRLEQSGYPIVSTIHDEIVCEVPYGFGSTEEMSSIMAQPVSWAADLHLRAEGFESEFYMKD